MHQDQFCFKLILYATQFYKDFYLFLITFENGLIGHSLKHAFGQVYLFLDLSIFVNLIFQALLNVLFLYQIINDLDIESFHNQ